MQTRDQVHLDGRWVEPHGTEVHELVDPRSGEVFARVRHADEVDVDRAVAVARRVFDEEPAWPVEERVKALRGLHDAIAARTEEIAEVISAEMGAPAQFSRQVQVGMGLATLATTIDVLEDYAFDEHLAGIVVAREPMGVVAAITPWNFPLHQSLTKIGSALAAGCPVILKPAETTPLSAYLLMEAAEEAGVPAGWLQLLPGRGTVVGAALATHPGVDAVSFTGSTAVGRSIASGAGASLKRLSLELGGKSPSVLLDDLDDEGFATAVRTSVGFGLMNAGQTCAAWTRLIVPEARYDEAVAIAGQVAGAAVPGETLGPVASRAQWDRVTGYLASAVEEGAVVEHGDASPALPERGFHLAPVILGRVTTEMRVGREEIFGPVLAIQTHTGDDDAVRLANATEYGLSAGVFGRDQDRAIAVARRIRSGVVHVNGLNSNRLAPFGGYKQSGLGREYGRFGIEEFLEVKSIQPPATA